MLLKRALVAAALCLLVCRAADDSWREDSWAEQSAATEHGHTIELPTLGEDPDDESGDEGGDEGGGAAPAPSGPPPPGPPPGPAGGDPSCIKADTGLTWCQSPLGPPQQCQEDAGGPWADDAGNYPGRHYWDGPGNTPLMGSSCPSPLKAACAKYGARVAHLQGPIDCGNKGYFCRIVPEDGWRNPHPNIMSMDKLRGFREANFHHCNLTKKPTEGEQLLADPDFGHTTEASGSAGHCHGSDADDAYGWWVRDHWSRGYAGTLHCCCDWKATVGVVDSCDFRRHVKQAGETPTYPGELPTGACVDANEDHKAGGLGPSTYEGGCKRYGVQGFKDPLYTNGGDSCWSVKSFANPCSVQPVPTGAKCE